MIDRYKPRAYAGIGVGIWFMTAGGSMARMGEEWAQTGVPLGLVGWGILIFGCTSYAQAKGYSPWFGLVGFLALLGPLILLLFPDRYPPPDYRPGGQPASSPFSAAAARATDVPYPALPSRTSSGAHPGQHLPEMTPTFLPRPASKAGLKVVLWVIVGLAGLGLMSCAGMLVAVSIFLHGYQQGRATQVQEPSRAWPDVPAPAEMRIPMPERPGGLQADVARLKAGDRLDAQWAGQWYPVQVVEVLPGGFAKVHWTSRDDLPEMVLPAALLRVPPETQSP